MRRRPAATAGALCVVAAWPTQDEVSGLEQWSSGSGSPWSGLDAEGTADGCDANLGPGAWEPSAFPPAPPPPASPLSPPRPGQSLNKTHEQHIEDYPSLLAPIVDAVRKTRGLLGHYFIQGYIETDWNPPGGPCGLVLTRNSPPPRQKAPLGLRRKLCR